MTEQLRWALNKAWARLTAAFSELRKLRLLTGCLSGDCRCHCDFCTPFSVLRFVISTCFFRLLCLLHASLSVTCCVCRFNMPGGQQVASTSDSASFQCLLGLTWQWQRPSKMYVFINIQSPKNLWKPFISTEGVVALCRVRHVAPPCF